jgi:hypothetical protein
MALFRQDAPKRTTVYVDDVPVRVAEEVTGAELLRAAGKSPDNYSLVTQDEQGGSQLLPSSRRIKPVASQRFEANLPGIGG